jgi:hypothetical protein
MKLWPRTRRFKSWICVRNINTACLSSQWLLDCLEVLQSSRIKHKYNKFSVSEYLYNYHWAGPIFLYISTAENAQATKQITNIHRFYEPLFTVLWLVHVNSCIPARCFCSAVREYSMYSNLNKNIKAQPIFWLGYGFDIRQRQRILKGFMLVK